MNTPRQVSRLWLRRHARPRTDRGHFAPGFILWTRSWDKQSRWLYWPPMENSDDKTRAEWLNAEVRRVFVVVGVLMLLGVLATLLFR